MQSHVDDGLAAALASTVGMKTMDHVKQRVLEAMAEGVTAVLPSFDEPTGRFLAEPEGPTAPGAAPEDIGWCVINQDIIYPLAVLHTTPGTPFHGDEKVLEMALRGGDAIRDFQYPDGRVEFLKVDGSRWGPTYMGWTNYAWLETYALLRDELDGQRRSRWEEGLTLAHDGQAKEISDGHIHNIPCWKAMSCCRAVELLDRPDWKTVGTAMIHAVVDAQQPGGYWAEHGGPSVLYNHVYVHGIGLYYAFTRDERVLPALEAASELHQTFSYPNGVPVETVDGRVKYHDRLMSMGWVGFSACPKGRRLVRLLAEQLVPERDVKRFQGGAIASAVQHLIEGDEATTNVDRPAFRESYRDWAVVCREQPWFGCLSAFACPPVASRWGQDRQAFLSLWHEEHGLILGGGNSKDQPEWSSFVADGRFIPDAGELLDDGTGVDLTYGRVRCRLRLLFEEHHPVIEAGTEGGPALQQFVIQTAPGDVIRTATGQQATLQDTAVQWGPAELGAWLEWKGLQITVPTGAMFRWPTTPFNPYAADGAASFGSERSVLSARIDGAPIRWGIEPA